MSEHEYRFIGGGALALKRFSADKLLFLFQIKEYVCGQSVKCGLFWFILFEVAIAARMRASKKLLSYQSKSKAELSAETCLWSVQSIADYFVMKNYFIEFLAKDKGRGIM